MKQEKTIEDYRRDIKLLKLKYLKIQEEKNQLEATVQKLAAGQGITQSAAAPTDYGISSSSPSKNSANYMSHDKNVMREFSIRCKQTLGLTPESLFRAADVEGSGVITDQQFKSFLLQSKLNLSAQHVQRILQLSDASCTGMIKKNQYFECLSAFQINQETNSTSVDKSSNRTFVQKSLVKFAANLVSQKVSPHDCFTTMDQGRENLIYYDDLNSYVAKYCKDMNETECIGAFNYLDIEKEQKIGRDMFVVEMKKVMRVVAKEKNVNVDGFIDNKSNAPSRPQNNSGTALPPTGRRNSAQAEPPADDRDQFNAAPVHVDVITEKDIVEALNKMQGTYKIDLETFLVNLVSTTSHPTSGIFLTDFFKTFEKMKIARKIPNELKMKFFRAIDIGNNGSIDYEELSSFYVERKTDRQPISLVNMLAARVLQSIDIRSEEAFTFLNVQRDSVLEEKNFRSVAKKIYFITKPELMSKLFKELAHGKDKIVAEILIDDLDREIDNLVGVDLLNQSGTSKSSGKLARSTNRKLSSGQGSNKSKGSLSKLNTKLLSVETDVKEYEKIMREIYPSFNKEADFFEKVEKNDDGGVNFTQWATILNDELPTLKKALEIVQGLQDGEMWSDPEFGPNEKDPYGSKSMYFSDNDVPSGCPPPENVTWMRIQDILDHYLENNTPEEGGEVMDEAHFLMAGASANDVQQSSYLGDCWFVSALSIIAQKDAYIVGSYDSANKDVTNEKFMLQMSEGTYPPMFHFLHKYGIFVLKFYKNFEWRYVIIDDKLPCLDGKIIYSHCRKPNEFWVALIEKAYAKIHNCYQALTSGDIGQGLTDLTGQVSMKMRFESMMKVTREQLEAGDFDKTGVQINGVKFECNEDNYEEVYQKLVRQRDKFWATLSKFIEQDTLIGCSADGGTESAITYNDEKAGIYSGHAYSLINAFTLDYLSDIADKHDDHNSHKNHRLLCLRNPWGFGEWLLKWSETEDSDDRIIDKYIGAIDQYYEKKIKEAKQKGQEPPEKYAPGVDDGMFIMCFKDWRNIFSNLFLCFKFDPSEWLGYEVEDKWTKGFCSGTVKKGEPSITNFALQNPQFTFTLKKEQKAPVQAFLNLVQDDGRLYAGAKYPYENIQESLLLCLFVLEPGQKKLQKFDQKLMILSSGKFNLRREVDFGKLVDVQPGKTYCVVPCTMRGEVPGEPFKDIDFSINFYFSNCPDSDMDFQKVNGQGPLKKQLVSVTAVDPSMAQNSSKLKAFLKASAEDKDV